MRPKLLILITTLLFASFSCYERKVSKTVQINSKKDTVKIGELYRAELSVTHLDSIQPSFKIVYKNDTLNIPFYNDINQAVYQAVSKVPGEKIINGYVEFFDLQGNLKKESFIIEFFVADKY